MKDAAICLEIPAGIMQASAPGRWFLILTDECNSLFIILIYAVPLYFIALLSLCFVLRFFFDNAIIWQNLLSSEIISYFLWIETHYFDRLIRMCVKWGRGLGRDQLWLKLFLVFGFWDFHDKLSNSVDLDLQMLLLNTVLKYQLFSFLLKLFSI